MTLRLTKDSDLGKIMLGEMCPKGHTKVETKIETAEDRKSGKAFYKCLECGLEWTLEASLE